MISEIAVKLRLEDRHDFVCPRVDDDDLIANQDVLKASPRRIDLDHLHRERIKVHARWDAGADADRTLNLVGSTLCCLMIEVIFVRCSVDSLAEPAAAPWPVVVERFCSVVL